MMLRNTFWPRRMKRLAAVLIFIMTLPCCIYAAQKMGGGVVIVDEFTVPPSAAIVDGSEVENSSSWCTQGK